MDKSLLNDLLQSFTKEFEQLAEDEETVTLEFKKFDLWILMSQLQLASRHPKNRGPMSKVARVLAQRFQSLVASKGALKEVAELGWNPDFDE